MRNLAQGKEILKFDWILPEKSVLDAFTLEALKDFTKCTTRVLGFYHFLLFLHLIVRTECLLLDRVIFSLSLLFVHLAIAFLFSHRRNH